MAKQRFQAGKLDRRVQIQRKQMTQTASGEQEYAWASIGEYWAGVDYLTGFRAANEDEEAESILATTQVRFTMRYNTTIRVDDRLIDLNSRETEDIYDIRGVVEDGRRHIMVLNCERYRPEAKNDDLNSFSDPQFDNSAN